MNLDELLCRWPERFRFAEVLVLLSDGGSYSAEAFAAALLDDVAADRSDRQTFDYLLTTGRFAVAELFLDQCESFADVYRSHERLRSEVASRMAEAETRIHRLAERAERAGVPVVIDRNDIEAAVSRSWPRALEILDGADQDFQRRLDEERRTLKERAAQRHLSPTPEGTFTALLEQDNLRAAGFFLEHEDPTEAGPDGIPPLPSWRWAPESPESVLSWQLDPNRPRPRQFASWELDDDASALLAAFDELTSNSEPAVLEFVEALERFVQDAPSSPPQVHQVEGGYLTTIRNLYDDDRIRGFGQSPSVSLLIVDDSVTDPPQMAGIGNYVVVGRQLERAEHLRNIAAAVVDLPTLLQLTAGRTERRISLLRELSRQWPLSALGAGSSRQLERTLGGDERDRWQTLRWITALGGLGDVTVAETLVHQTLYNPDVLHLMLTFLRQPTSRTTLQAWYRDEPFAASIEAAALHELHDSPSALAAFWLALAASAESVDLDALVLAAELLHPNFDYKQLLSHGLAELAGQWFVRHADARSVTFEPCGVLLGLQRFTHKRATDMVRLLATESPDTASEATGDAGRWWSAYRYALSQSWPAYAASELADPGVRESAFRTLTETPLPEVVTADTAGSCDVPDLVARMLATLGQHFPEVNTSLEYIVVQPVLTNDRVVTAILYEVLQNAVEAMAGNGQLSVVIRQMDSDVIVDVLDSGTGIPDEIESDHRIFRPNVSTKGHGRGSGLHNARILAQLVGGDVYLSARSRAHPIFIGAHFKIALPVAGANT